MSPWNCKVNSPGWCSKPWVSGGRASEKYRCK
jgi:hypothetical protein